MTFEKVAGFYPDLQGLVAEDASFERKALGEAPLEARGEGYLARLSNNKTDRDGDIVIAEGVVIDYYTGTLLWNHNLTGLPIGLCEGFRVEAGEALGVLKFATEYDFAEDVHSLVAQKMLRGISIGYIPRKVALRGTPAFNEAVNKYSLDASDCKRILLSVELIEVSMVPVGANREAMILAIASKAFVPSVAGTKALGLDDPTSQMLINMERKIMSLEAKAPAADAAVVAGTVELTAEPVVELVAEPVVEAPVEDVPVVEAPVPEPVVEETVVEPEAVVEAPPAPAPLVFTVIRKGGYQIDTNAVSTKAAALVRGRLV